ncbi:FG-GAP-like repeat-containing protein [Hymenobacter sp. GOD-10R]|uniref:FG-GAP-like repeat-containing protein n=1 Tax=Hymenobacter sp. GOD-10R TaxID=3093922 RepID=UPI002D77A2AB|nr:FG-GAP-like repeat-containing protein [Hymenobacter sp. GOD-10R]WRQ27644.1 FG-GAP-like repeat-containing protein [Hymenobacter sp. GOD-10R]
MTTSTSFASRSTPAEASWGSALRAGCAALVLAATSAQAQTPTVTSLTPARNAVATPRTTPVSVSFSQPLTSSASTLGALKVFSRQAGGKKAGTATVNGNTLTLTPSTAFRAGETVYATVTSAAQSSTGAAATPHVFQFTTATTPAPGVFTVGSELNSGTLAVTTGDLDNDGDLDLVTANTSSTVGVRMNLGGGIFSVGQDLRVGVYPINVVLGDLDSDGDLDLVTVDGNPNTNGVKGVNVSLNDGGGNFSAGQRIDFSTNRIQTTLGDVDGDGDLDLLTVLGRSGGSVVNVRLNDGGGTFVSSSEVATGAIGNDLAVGDVDNDGDLDLLTCNLVGTVSVRLNNGLGAFSGNQEVAAVGSNSSGLTVGDIDKDGDLDLLIANFSNDNVSVRRNNGAGLFSGSEEVAVGNSPQSLILGDIDGDGDLDLLTGNYGSTNVSVRLNNSFGTFSNGQEVATNGSSKATLGDMDNDGDLDLLIGTPQKLSVSLNQEPALTVTAVSPARNARAVARTTPIVATFSQPLNNSTVTQNALKVFSLQAGGQKAGTTTINGNSLTFTPTTGFKPGETVSATIARTVQNSSGQNLAQGQVLQFTTATVPSSGLFAGGSELTPYGGVDIETGDLDNDGDLDLISASGGIYRNNGNGTFVTSGTSVGGNSVAIGDLDGDGDLDYVAGILVTDGLLVGLNDGNATFTVRQAIGAGGYFVNVRLVDIDADGDLDVLAGAAEGGVVYQALNNGSGSFSRGTSIFVDVRLTVAPAVGDLDNDGDLDIVATATYESTARVVLNNGSGSFSTGSEVAIGIGAVAIALADIDGDGDLDLLTANSRTVSVRLNNGSGVFSGTQEVAAGGSPRSVTTGDVDGDGDLDFVAANANNNIVSVCLNNGTGIFSSQQVAVGASSYAVALGDLDGNGTLDFASVNNNSNAGSVSVRLNSQVLATKSAKATQPLSLYPNPAHTSVRLQLPSGFSGQAGRVSVINAVGQVVLERALTTAASSELSLPSLAPGIYTVQLSTSQGNLASRLLVE